MAKFLSNRQRSLDVGISSYTEGSGVLTITGNTNISGIVTAIAGAAVTYYGDGSNLTNLPPASVSISTTPPTSPSPGDLWYSPDYARTLIYYNDGSSSQWIDASPFNVGILTVTNFTASNLNVTSGLNVTGVVTATSFVGDGSGLTGLANTAFINAEQVNVVGVVTASSAVFTGNVSIGGTLTYEDVTNVDSVGLITARTGVRVTTGGIEVSAGGLNVTGVSTFSSDVDISGNITSNVTIVSTDAGSSAAPELTLYRNSASPADADYIGQIKFAGESDTGVQRNYAKITGKIGDASNGTEDGILEFAHIKNGSQNISGRWNSTTLQLLNGTDLSVAGDVTATSYYGDGSNLTGLPTQGVGINTAGGSVGTGVTILDFRGAGISTVTVTAGIATLNITGGGGSGSISISTTAPTSPSAGDLWYNPDYGRTLIYYDEAEVGYGTSKQWIDSSPLTNTGILTSTNINTNNLYVTGVATATSFVGSGASLTNIPNSALDNSTVSYGGVQLSLGGSDATPAFDLTDAINYPYSSLTGITTEIVGDTTPQLGGNLDLNGSDITGTGNINITGIVTATSFEGDGSNLTGLPTQGVGINTAGGSVGTGVTILDFRGAGISTVTVAAGIATLNIEGGGSGSISISTTAPTSPTSGDLWYSPDYGRTFIYYDEAEVGYGTSKQWVDAAPFNVGILSTTNLSTNNASISGIITASSFVKSGGTSSQFLKADGSVDSSTYITSSDNISGTAGGLSGSPSITVADITATGNVSIAGTLTYEDVTNVDSVGLITARSGIHVTGGSVGIGTDSPTTITSGNTNLTLGPGSTGSQGSEIHLESSTHNGANNGANISYIGSDLYVVNRESGNLTLWTNTTERMRITSSGNFGIGDSAPGSKLTVKDTTVGGTPVQIIGANNFTYNLRSLSDGSTDGRRFDINIGSSSGQISLSNSAAEFMRLTPTGIGIGIASPDQKLHVYGNSGTTFVSVGDQTRTAPYGYFGADASAGKMSLVSRSAHPLTFQIETSEVGRFDTSGRLLVGTSSASGSYLIQSFGNSGSSTGSGGIVIGRNTSSVGNSSTLGSVYFSNTNSDTLSAITCFSDGTQTTNSSTPGTITFATTGSGATSPTERMRIDSSGRLLVARTSSTGSGEDIQDSKGGIRAIPQNSKTSSYTLVVSDAGKHISITTGGVTVPSGVFSIGDAVTIYNNSGSAQTITQGSSVTLRLAGDGTASNKTLDGYGLATILCVASNVFVIGGAGVS